MEDLIGENRKQRGRATEEHGKQIECDRCQDDFLAEHEPSPAIKPRHAPSAARPICGARGIGSTSTKKANAVIASIV